MALFTRSFSVDHVFTRDDVLSIREGDILANCFGRCEMVTSITYRGVDINGRAFVGFYQTFGEGGGGMSNSVKEGEAVVTVR